MPPRPRPPTPTRAGRVSRRTTIALIGGAVALVAVIAAAVGIAAIHRSSESSLTSSESSPTSSLPPTSSRRSYAAPVVLPFTRRHSPKGVTVDSAGNLYVTDWGNNRVLKWPFIVGPSTQEVLPFTGVNPVGVAVDSAGTLYVTDDSRVLKLPVAVTRSQPGSEQSRSDLDWALAATVLFRESS
jgi:serine/threonine protein kinase, bacterial